MKPTQLASLFAGMAAPAAAPAFAQSAEDGWSGFHIGGRVGDSEPGNDDDSSILFDTPLDGSFGDTVNTAATANASSPGFCHGAALGRTPAAGCSDERACAPVMTGSRVAGSTVQ